MKKIFLFLIVGQFLFLSSCEKLPFQKKKDLHAPQYEVLQINGMAIKFNKFTGESWRLSTDGNQWTTWESIHDSKEFVLAYDSTGKKLYSKQTFRIENELSNILGRKLNYSEMDLIEKIVTNRISTKDPLGILDLSAGKKKEKFIESHSK